MSIKQEIITHCKYASEALVVVQSSLCEAIKSSLLYNLEDNAYSEWLSCVADNIEYDDEGELCDVHISEATLVDLVNEYKSMLKMLEDK